MRRGMIVFLAVMAMAVMAFAQTPIHDIQFVPDPVADDASPLNGTDVTIEGWVTFEPGSSGGSKWYVADAAGAWNGIYINGDPGRLIGFGWQVEVTGTVSEAYGLTQIEFASVTVLDSVVDWAALPAACEYTVVNAADIGEQTVATAEQYESVLVQVDDVTCTSEEIEYGEWQVQDGNGNAVRIDDPWNDDYGYAHMQMLGMPYEYIRGILNYSFDMYKIEPEIARDLKVQEVTDNPNPDLNWYTPFAWFQQVRLSDVTPYVDNTGTTVMNDGSYASSFRYGGLEEYQDTVTVRGIVTMPTGISYAGAGVKFIFVDYRVGDANAPWSAVLSYDPDNTLFPNLNIGHEIVAKGYISEYNTNQANMTELFITEPIQTIGAGRTIPADPVLETADLRNPHIAERWETAFISVENGVVADNDQPYNELFIIDSNTDDEIPGLIVDADSDSLNDGAFIPPPVGTLIELVRGWLYPHYGSISDELGDNYYLKIEPLYQEDIVIGEGPPIIMSVNRNPGVPVADDPVVITAEISDNSQVISASVFWKLAGEETFQELAMTNTGGIVWEATIPDQVEGTNVWYYVQAIDDSQESSTDPTNPEENLLGYWTVDDLTIYHVQYTPFSAGTSPYNGQLVTLTGVVTTDEVNYSGAELDRGNGPEIFGDYGGYYMQTGDDPAYNAICFRVPEGGPYPNAGDVVSVTGTVDDNGTIWATKWDQHTMLVNVVDVSIAEDPGEFTIYPVDAATVNADLEAYEGAFVQFNNMTVTAINSYDWGFTDESGEEFLFDDDMIGEAAMLDWYDGIQVDDTIEMMRGILVSTFGSWKLEPRNSSDCSEVETGINEGIQLAPYEFALNPVYPNPFNPVTHIRYSLPFSGDVNLAVYNSLGQKVTVLVNGTLSAGQHSATWNGQSTTGMQVASGQYFLRLQSGENISIQKMILLK